MKRMMEKNKYELLQSHLYTHQMVQPRTLNHDKLNGTDCQL